MTKNILLLCGGKSAEHEVSLHSAKNIELALKDTPHNITTIIISKDGKWSCNKKQ